MEAFLRDLGLEEYYPRFMAQGMDDVEEARTSRQLDSVLETVGMDCNPGHVSKFKRALAKFERGAATGGSDERSGDEESRRVKKQKTSSSSADPALTLDPAAAVRAAMAAAKARGGGVVGGGDAVKRAPGSSSGGSGFYGGAASTTQKRLAAASEAEVLDVLSRFRARDFLRLFGFPGAPVDDRGKCDWKTHPVSKPGDVALRAKLLSLRLDPSLPGAHASAREARDAVASALKQLDDKETKKEILTLAVRRRVDEMRRQNIGDVSGGYVSVTGVHYAAGAAAAQVSDYKADDAGEGPAMNPAARLRAGQAAVEKRARSGDGTEDRSFPVDGPDDVDVGTLRGPSATAAKPKVDLGSIRDKLKKKKAGPRFM